MAAHYQSLLTQDAIDSDTRAFLRSLPPPPDGAPSVAESRLRESQMQNVEVAKKRVDIEDGVVQSLGRDISIRVLKPLGWKNGPLPVVLFIHGGGWVVGGKDTHDRLVRDIAHGAETAVVFVDYSRAPEARYPVAVEEAYAALTWVKEQGHSVGLDATRVALVGDSAGRKYRRRSDAPGADAWRPSSRPAGAALSRDRREFRAAVVYRILGRLLSDARRAAMGVGSVCARTGDAQRSHSRAAACHGLGAWPRAAGPHHPFGSAPVH